MKLLVIPDVHCRKFWRRAIDDNIGKVDKVIFLGDYVDPYHIEIEREPESMEVTEFYDSDGALKMLNDIISLKKNEPDKFILFTGNHTDSYIWPNFTAATRTDNQHWNEYHKFFSENLNFFNFVYIENDTIFSHAGITEGWAEQFLYKYMKYDVQAELEKSSVILETAQVLKDTPLKNFNESYIAAIDHISHYRGGDYFYGSCEWADIREHIDVNKSITEIVPKGDDNVYQIFGHTQLKDYIITDKWACLDCRKAFIVDTLTHEISEC